MYPFQYIPFLLLSFSHNIKTGTVQLGSCAGFFIKISYGAQPKFFGTFIQSRFSTAFTTSETLSVSMLSIMPLS